MEPGRAPRMYVLVGVPGSGKTTYARRAFPHAIRISLDDLRLMMSGVAYDPRYEPMVSAAAEAMLEALVARAPQWGRDLVFDATNVTRAWRARLIERCHRHGVEPHCVFIAPPIEVALWQNTQRRHTVPEDVLRRFADQLEPPSAEEGFVTIRVIH